MPTPKSIIASDNMCCGHKRCPDVKAFSDGTVTVEDDGKLIEFDEEQADRLTAVLEVRRITREVL